jgi:hypothetical protein
VSLQLSRQDNFISKLWRLEQVGVQHYGSLLVCVIDAVVVAGVPHGYR